MKKRIAFKHPCGICGTLTPNAGMCDDCRAGIEKALENVREGFNLPPPKPTPDEAYQSALAAIATGTCREWLRQRNINTALIGEADLAQEVARVALSTLKETHHA